MRFAKRSKLHICHDDLADWYERQKEKDNPYVIRGYGGRGRRVRTRRYDIRNNNPLSGKIEIVRGRDRDILPTNEASPTYGELNGFCFGGSIGDTLSDIRRKLSHREHEKSFRFLIERDSQSVGSFV